MPYDEFDVYKTALDDANELLRRRGDADNLYVGIVTLILTGEAYLFVTSQFDSWLPVIVTASGESGRPRHRAALEPRLRGDQQDSRQTL